MEYNILLGGAAGQGMDTISHILEKTLNRSGFFVFSTKDYMSRIRGGHNFYQIRFGTEPLFAQRNGFDLIIALNQETIVNHQQKLNSSGKILCDEAIAAESENIISLPLSALAKDIGNPKVVNTLAAGAFLKIFGIPLDKAEELLANEFSGDILTANLKALQEGNRIAPNVFDSINNTPQDTIFINGNEAISLGAIAAGCRYYCGYPMTPSTSIMNYLAKHAKEVGMIVEQTEDEIAAINMALGASFAGLRSMVATSGGGFALMVEALSLAGITETPIVIGMIQRPGPATGFPTRTEDADLRFVIHAGHGEFARLVIALRDPNDAFYQTIRAFDLAEKYQIPVIILSDQYLADYAMTIKPFDFSKITVERYFDDGSSLAPGEKYKRYKLTDNGISPLLIPGKVKGQVIYVDSDEHDEEGHITESAEMRIAMVNKRLQKYELLRQELIEPDLLGMEDPDILMVGWGSIYGPLKEAVESLNREGVAISALVFGDIWPLPTKRLKKMAEKAKSVIDIEQNATAQLDGLMRQEALLPSSKRLLKYDGRAWSADEVYNRIRREVL